MISEIRPVEVMSVSDGTLLFFPLGPSTNARMGVVRIGQHCRQILTKDARDYIGETSRQLWVWKLTNDFKTIEAYTHFDIWFVLPRTNSDGHNYLKCLLDCLETGGIVKNDKFILPRIQGIAFDKETWAIVKLPKQN